MPGFLTPALYFGSGALIGIGIFLALNSEVVRERISATLEESEVYWNAIKEVYAQRHEEHRDEMEEPESEFPTAEKATGLFLAPDAASESEPEKFTLRNRFAEQQRRSFVANEETLDALQSESASSVPGLSPPGSASSSSYDRSSPELFAIYTVEQASSSDEDVDEESDRSDANEFSSYDKLDSELSSH